MATFLDIGSEEVRAAVPPATPKPTTISFSVCSVDKGRGALGMLFLESQDSFRWGLVLNALMLPMRSKETALLALPKGGDKESVL